VILDCAHFLDLGRFEYDNEYEYDYDYGTRWWAMPTLREG